MYHAIFFQFWTAEDRRKHCIDDHQFSSDFKFNDYKKIGKKTNEKKKPKSKHISNENSNISTPSASHKGIGTYNSKNAMELDENECSSTNKKESVNDISADISCTEPKIQTQSSKTSATKIVPGQNTKSDGIKFTCKYSYLSLH